MPPEPPIYKPDTAATVAVEALLLDHVQRLKRFTEGRRAIHVHLSRLRPYNRRRHHLRIAASAFEPLASGHEGIVFTLFNDDLVVICKDATVAEIDDFVLRLRFLFSDDPLLVSEADEQGDDPFCSWFDLEADYPAFVEAAEAMLRERELAEAMQAADDPEETPETVAAEPIDPPKLGAIEDAIAHADLSSFLRRQAICAVAKDSPPKPLLHELTISIDGLRHALLPTHDFVANQWLFRDLTRHLDRRMIAMLRHRDEAAARESMSLNFNVATLLSPEFMEFDAVIAAERSGTVVIELQLVDVIADLAGFAFARDFLRDRGYRICLDGTNHLSLPFVDRAKLGVDLLKLCWSSDLADSAAGPHRDALRDAIDAFSAERVILCHCDTPEALELGRALGITLYQGYHLDDLLAQAPRKGEDLERLVEAMRRHRMAARSHR